MSTVVCLAVLLGTAAPSASFSVPENPSNPAVRQPDGQIEARFHAVDRSFEQFVLQPPADGSHWLSRLPRLEMPSLLASQAGSHETVFLIRGQSPPYDPSAAGNSNLSQSMTLPPAATEQWYPQQQPIWPGVPMLNPNGMMGGAPPQAMMAGVNGPQPFRFGWQSQADVGFLPDEKTDFMGQPKFSVFELNTEMRYTTPAPMQHVFSIAPQYNLRVFDLGDSEEFHRFGLDLRLTSPTCGPYTVELDFNPSFGTDFEAGLSSNAWMFDVRGALFYRASPQSLLVLGALFWDRLDDRVLPYAGIVFTPNQYIEIRALFPKSEISFFLGTPWGVPQWLYLAGEYHVEAYQIDVGIPGFGDGQIQIEDRRAVLGVRSEHYGMTSFLEAGWVWGRHIKFGNITNVPDFGSDVADGFIVRFGLRY